MTQHELGTNDVPQTNEPVQNTNIDVDTNEVYTNYEEILTSPTTEEEEQQPTAPETTPEQVTLTPEQVEIYKIRLSEETYSEILKVKAELDKLVEQFKPASALTQTVDTEDLEHFNSNVMKYTLLIDSINEALKEALDRDGIDDINLEGKLNFWWVLNNHNGIIQLVKKLITIVKLFKENNNI